ncbi:FAD-dependent oxidoreductase [Mangrovicoccus ximenensis]|uniref:FAD-dependent oxidoreductase n=1 Tax=Mangrovicoccus ximenensis TaxID=1911570 RepID=UPI000D3A9828|nr:FAD-dependent oxidoreductase [Mangrovicoccus ximenensis]
MSGSLRRDRAAILRLDGITKRFGPVLANDGIGFSLAEGEVLALLGENGAGKTTLMNILFGHYVADEGTVHVAGQELPPGQPGAALAAGVGMVHQHFTLAENLTVLDNVVLGTRPLFSLGSGRRAARARLRQLSEDFGLAVDPSARVADLSVGERQRVEILKALYRDARVLILDEPTAVLTPQEVDALFATIRKAVAKGLAVVFISHKLGEVMAVADRVVILRRGAKVAEMRTAETDRHRLAEAMVGAEIVPPEVPAVTPGAVLFRLDGVSVAGSPGLTTALGDSAIGVRARLDGGLNLAWRGGSPAQITPDSFRMFFRFLPSLIETRHELGLELGRTFFDEARMPKTWDPSGPSPMEAEEWRIWNPAPTERLLARARQAWAKRFPDCGTIEAADSWAGMMDVTPDAVPVISETPIPGLVLSTGYSGHGFGIGPGAGRLAADLASGTAPCVNPARFRLDRFGKVAAPKPRGLAAA